MIGYLLAGTDPLLIVFRDAVHCHCTLLLCHPLSCVFDISFCMPAPAHTQLTHIHCEADVLRQRVCGGGAYTSVGVYATASCSPPDVLLCMY